MPDNRSNERRIQKRVPCIKEIEIVGLGMRRCSDISIGGIYLETVSVFPEGTLLDLRFKLHDTDEYPIQVRARVTYIHPGMGVGLFFTNLSAQDTQKIQEWINHQ